ncbi:MAG: hypothetical protein E7388_05435 [Ruminococcaceae bacterium]|nr:hypothetical protein [Oscillospiraceae bacterium]
MKKFMVYLKFQLKYLLGISQIKNYMKKGPKAVLGIIGIGFLFLIVLASFLFLYLMMVVGMQTAGNMAGLPSLMPRFMITTGQIVILFTSLLSAFGMMAGGKSWEFEASLPVKSSYIFMSRLISLYATEIGFSAFIILPAIIVYAIFNGAGVMYWIYGILGIFIYPVIPVAIAVVIALLVTMLSAGFKKKELFTTIFSLIIMVVAIVGNMMLNSSGGSQTDIGADLVAMMSGRLETLNILSYILPVAGLLTNALTVPGLTGVLNFAGAVLVAMVVAVVLYIIGDKLYFKTVSKTTAAGKSDNKKYKSAGTKSVVKAFFVKEWRLILRSPVNLLNGLFNIVMGPIMLFFVFFKTSAEGGEEALVGFLNNYDGVFFAVTIGICLFMSALNLTWASTISREGPAFWIVKTAPVPVRDQMKGRFLAGYSMHLLCVVPMVIIMAVLIKPDMIELLLAALIAAFAGFFMVASNMMIDIAKPKLIWKLEAEAIKQNVNSVIGMLISWVWAIVICIAPVLSAVGVISLPVAFVISVVLAVGAGVGTYKGMIKFAENKIRYIW